MHVVVYLSGIPLRIDKRLSMFYASNPNRVLSYSQSCDLCAFGLQAPLPKSTLMENAEANIMTKNDVWSYTSDRSCCRFTRRPGNCDFSIAKICWSTSMIFFSNIFSLSYIFLKTCLDTRSPVVRMFDWLKTQNLHWVGYGRLIEWIFSS